MNEINPSTYIGMNLKDALTMNVTKGGIPYETIVHIGSRTQYIFVGTKRDYGVFKKYVTRIINSLTSRRDKKLEHAAAIVERVKSGLLKADKNIISRITSSTDVITAELKKVTSLEREIIKYQKMLKQFEAIPKRKIRDAYFTVSGGLALIVEGKEIGAFWDYEECRNALGMRDKKTDNNGKENK